MVSPSKAKHSRVAANQQQQQQPQRTAPSHKVKLVKGNKPLIHHRFYLDVQKHQLANKIEFTIKELGGHVEFFLNKDITHFITDKEDCNHSAPPQQDYQDGGPSNCHLQRPATPKTPLTHLQHLNEHQPPSSPACHAATPSGLPNSVASSGIPSVGSALPASPASASAASEIKSVVVKPRSRADAMLQRVREQQQQQNHHSPSSSQHHHLLAGVGRQSSTYPSSPAATSIAPPSPATPGVPAIAPTSTTNALRLDRGCQSPAQLARSWGKPIWSTEYVIRFFKKVIQTCKQDQQDAIIRAAHATPKGRLHIQYFRGNYIKIEATKRQNRPAFLLFKKWPALNLNNKPNESPFETDGTRLLAAAYGASSKRPGAQQQQQQEQKEEEEDNEVHVLDEKPEEVLNQCGYCEICRIEYDLLGNHLNSPEHREFARDDKNYETVDKLISEGGVGLEAFLSNHQELAVEDEQVEVKEQTERKNKVVPSGGNCAEDTKLDTECEEGERVAVEETKLDKENTIEDASKREEAPKPIRTYSRKSKVKHSTSQAAIPDPSDPTCRSAKRTYSGRKSAAAIAATVRPRSPPAAVAEEEGEEAAAELGPTSKAASAQMFGRRSAIHHHPHNTLNHHNHQKAKEARAAAAAAAVASSSSLATAEQQQHQEEEQENPKEDLVEEQGPEEETLLHPEAPEEDEGGAMKLHNDSGHSTTEKEKDRQSKRSAADRMGLKGSSLKPGVHHSGAELMECDGLDPKNTKRISLGLRQNPKRANLNEDFTSLLDETLGPMRKPRIRRESTKRVNYSEPRDEDIASQQLIESILLEGTEEEEVTENGGGKKKGGSPKRQSSDVKIRGIRWRAPSPQSRPKVKSPLLYKVIEDARPVRSKKTTSPTKDATGGSTPGSPTKAMKNGLIVKIRRVRQSELSLLNDEAENFMFPKKDDSSDEDTDEDRQTSSETGPGDYTQDIPSSDYDHRTSMRRSAGTPGPRKRTPGRPPATDSPSKKMAKESPADVSREQASTPVSGNRSRRTNRGVAALLNDNSTYYKFQDPGSRLRFPEAPIQPNPEVDEAIATTESAAPKRRGRKGRPSAASKSATATVTSGLDRQQQQDLLLATRSSPGSPYHHQEQLSNCGKNIINYVKGKEDGMGVFNWTTFNRNCKQIEPYRFAFERVPSLEPWFETFQRQDDSTEKMYEYFGNTAYRKLPYELGSLPPLKQNCCILNYRLKSKTPESTVPSSSNSSTCSGHAGTSKSKAAAAASASKSDKGALSLPLKKRKLLVDSDRPRKSPREHASTLAILSLLHHQQHNRRRTTSGGSSTGGSNVPLVTAATLPPPSPVYSPKKAAIQQQQQEADSALGDEIRSSCGSDPVTEKDEPLPPPPSQQGDDVSSAKKIKFDPPVLEERSFVNYKLMCQELESFLAVDDEGVMGEELDLPTAIIPVPTGSSLVEPIKRDLVGIVQACDKEPPLSLKLVNRHESIVRKIVQYDRKPRPLSAIPIKSFDGGGGGGLSFGMPSIGNFKKRINRTGWPNVKKRIVTRKQQQLLKVRKDAGEGESPEVVKKEESGDGSRKSSTEESQVSSVGTVAPDGEEAVVVEDRVKQEEEDEEEEDEDEFEDTMTMLDYDDGQTVRNDEKVEVTDDEADEEEPRTPRKKELEESRHTPEPNRTEEILIPSRSSIRTYPSSTKYVTKTTTTMTRVDYNVPSSSGGGDEPVPSGRNKPATGGGDDEDKECDSISSRSIFVSDDCDTTSSTLINMCAEDPLALPSTPQPPEESPERPPSRARQNNSRHLKRNSSSGGGSLQPVVCIEKLSCPSMRTRSSSRTRTPVKTYKRSVFTSALVNSAGKPLKKKKKIIKKKLKLNGNGGGGGGSSNGTGSPASSSPSCSDDADQNWAASSLECDPIEEDSPAARRSIKSRPPTPSPVKFSPRKLRKPRGRWYRER